MAEILDLALSNDSTRIILILVTFFTQGES